MSDLDVCYINKRFLTGVAPEEQKRLWRSEFSIYFEKIAQNVPYAMYLSD